MPAAAVKGIIVSISIIAALGVAVLENPQIQAWLEQQRQRLVELLRSIGEELDPQSRRQAEAFAYEGKTPVNDDGLRREATGSSEAAALATGRSLSSTASTIRRIPVKGPSDPDEAEERRRKGREYLAKRNQKMYELQQKRKAAKAGGASTPPSPVSFDAMVDDEGKLRLLEAEKELPSPPTVEPVPEHIQDRMREVEQSLVQPLLAYEPIASSSGWQLGSQLANPFGDEYAMDRSETPKPPVPPKVALEVDDEPRTPALPGSFTPYISQPQTPVVIEAQRNEDLSYDEQLAIALSLSEEEARASSAAGTSYGDEDDDLELRAAIQASLADKARRDASIPAEDDTPPVLPPRPAMTMSQPLVDLSAPSPVGQLRQPVPRGHWETLFDQDYSPHREPFSIAGPSGSQHSEEDELYSVTPQLTSARLASHNTEQALAWASCLPPTTLPYDPVRETTQEQPAAMEASFYSAISAASPAPSPASTQSHTLEHEPTPQLIDVSEDVRRDDGIWDGTQTPVSRSSFGFETDHESESDTFASVSGPASRIQSRPRSEVSNVEVVDVVDDSDVDMLSEEGDGVATPDSWTEVGSRDGESEMEDEEPRRSVRI